MGPGPSDVSPRVLRALARPTIGHLDPAFVALMDEVKVLLAETFRTEDAFTMPVSGPGTAGMEACVVNLVEPGSTSIVCRNGVFGDRLRQMVERAGGIAVVVDSPWGRAVDPDAVDRALETHPEAETLMFVHAETSTGAASDADARLAARAIANSPLVKTAVHGGDPNWGRLVSAAGRSGAAFVLDRASVSIGDVNLFVGGVPHDERADDAARVLAAQEVAVTVDVGAGGQYAATMWTCDFSAEYVRINAEYRT